MTNVAQNIIEPGFFTSPSVHVALVVGSVVAVVSGLVGVFTVIRSQSFAGHSLADVGTTGGSGAFLIGIPPLWGFLGLNVLAAVVMEMIGIQRPRGRDLAMGIVLGASLGLSALFLYWSTTIRNTTGAASTVLFGSIFSISASLVPVVIVFSLACLVLILTLYRPLLLSTLSPDMARARGVPVRLVGFGYLLTMAVAVALSALTIGAILSTALLIGPSATALRLSRRPGVAIIVAALLGVAATWLGVLLAYDSFYWPPAGNGWPVSVFIVILIFVSYLVTDLPVVRRMTQSSDRGQPGRPGSAARPRARDEAGEEGETVCLPAS